MGMVYDVTYPHQAGMDANVGDGYLDHLLNSLGERELAVARNTNWDRHVLYHWEGVWMTASELPKQASLAYHAGPEWERREARRMAAERAARPLHVVEVIIGGGVVIGGGHLRDEMITIERRTLVDAARQEDPTLRAAYSALLAEAVRMAPSFRPEEYR